MGQVAVAHHLTVGRGRVDVEHRRQRRDEDLLQLGHGRAADHRHVGQRRQRLRRLLRPGDDHEAAAGPLQVGQPHLHLVRRLLRPPGVDHELRRVLSPPRWPGCAWRGRADPVSPDASRPTSAGTASATTASTSHAQAVTSRAARTRPAAGTATLVTGTATFGSRWSVASGRREVRGDERRPPRIRRSSGSPSTASSRTRPRVHATGGSPAGARRTPRRRRPAPAPSAGRGTRAASRAVAAPGPRRPRRPRPGAAPARP